MAKNKVIDPIGQILTLAARRHRIRTAAMLSDIGLFPGQDKVLEALQGVDGLTMSEIAATLDVRPPTASKMVARMAAQDLLERKGREGDARMVMVSITEVGRGRLDDLRRIAKRVEREALDGLDDKDIRRLRRLLKKLARNLAGKGAGHEARLPDGDAADAGDMPEPADAEDQQPSAPSARLRLNLNPFLGGFCEVIPSWHRCRNSAPRASGPYEGWSPWAASRQSLSRALSLRG